jgi:hypothetical protein
MIKLIKKILGICDHNWITRNSIPVFTYTIKECQCTKCGAWKKFEV